MRGRKRRARYSWFPALGTPDDDEILPSGENWSFVNGDLFANDTLARDLIVTALTFDYPVEVEEGLATVPSLADFQGSEYQLERIVGKLHAKLRPGPIQSGLAGAQFALFSAGLIVLRVEEQTGAPLRSDLEEYTTLTASNISDPWIWRRTWVLGSDDVITQSAIPFVRPTGLPKSTAEFGDIESGPHVDARSVRRVRREERVFLVTDLVQLDLFLNPSKSTGASGVHVDYLFDYRILGKLVKASAHGNTSR